MKKKGISAYFSSQLCIVNSTKTTLSDLKRQIEIISSLCEFLQRKLNRLVHAYSGNARRDSCTNQVSTLEASCRFIKKNSLKHTPPHTYKSLWVYM